MRLASGRECSWDVRHWSTRTVTNRAAAEPSAADQTVLSPTYTHTANTLVHHATLTLHPHHTQTTPRIHHITPILHNITTVGGWPDCIITYVHTHGKYTCAPCYTHSTPTPYPDYTQNTPHHTHTTQHHNSRRLTRLYYHLHRHTHGKYTCAPCYTHS